MIEQRIESKNNLDLTFFISKNLLDRDRAAGTNYYFVHHFPFWKGCPRFVFIVISCRHVSLYIAQFCAMMFPVYQILQNCYQVFLCEMSGCAKSAESPVCHNLKPWLRTSEITTSKISCSKSLSNLQLLNGLCILTKLLVSECPGLCVLLTDLRIFLVFQTPGLRVVTIFEGRDAAGKGGIIRRIAERTSPRTVIVNALGTPSDKEKTQWYFQVRIL
jgi:hypothetical protein